MTKRIAVSGAAAASMRAGAIAWICRRLVWRAYSMQELGAGTYILMLRQPGKGAIRHLNTTVVNRIHNTPVSARETFRNETRASIENEPSPEDTTVASKKQRITEIAPSDITLVTPWVKRLTDGVWRAGFDIAGGQRKSPREKAGNDISPVINLEKPDPLRQVAKAWGALPPTQKIRFRGEITWTYGKITTTKKIQGYDTMVLSGKGDLAVGDCFVAKRTGDVDGTPFDVAKPPPKGGLWRMVSTAPIGTGRRQGWGRIFDSASSDRDQSDGSELPRVQQDGIRFGMVVKIFYYIKSSGTKLVHCRWFDIAGSTLLREMASPHELVLLSSCSTIEAYSICGKVDVKFLSPGEQETVKGFNTADSFICRYHYDKKTGVFEDVAKYHNAITTFDHCEEKLKCESCEITRRELLKHLPIVKPDGQGQMQVRYKDTTYRVGDFVYFIEKGDNDGDMPTKHNTPFQIGQIREIRPAVEEGKPNRKKKFIYDPDVDVTLVVSHLYRCDDKDAASWQEYFEGNRPAPPRDNRKLYSHDQTGELSARNLEGKCFVKYSDEIDDLNAWKDSSPHTFWMDRGEGGIKQVINRIETISLQDTNKKPPNSNRESTLLPPHPVTESERITAESDIQRFLDSNKPLRGLDIYAGAGGLSMGLEMSGVVKTTHAIELDPYAAEAYRMNHPHAVVYNQCSSRLLDRAVREARGERLDVLSDCLGKHIPTMPKPGEIDFIFGGPPCQGFSTMNRLRTPDDSKNALVVTFLSYLEHYRPAYFLLENVFGLLQCRLADIERGTAKWIVRAMTSMGYQTKFGILHAGQYGVPQQRRRVFVWGAKNGHKLPAFPQPTHCFGTEYTTTGYDGDEAPAAFGLQHANRFPPAPHPMVTVGDAISDLPGFEYVNPHVVLRSTQEEIKEKARSKIFPAYEPVGQWYTGEPGKQSYNSPPLSEFQRFCRKGVKDDSLSLHFTPGFTSKETIERVMNVPLRPNADYNDLPDELRKRGEVNWNGRDPYGRLDFNGCFLTAMTRIGVTTGPGKVLHPLQKRVITVREHARSQSFPDHTAFCSSAGGDNYVSQGILDLTKQIGNAVPVLLAKALGDELKKALVEEFVKNSKAD